MMVSLKTEHEIKLKKITKWIDDVIYQKKKTNVLCINMLKYKAKKSFQQKIRVKSD